MQLISSLNSKGQASFEMMFVLSVVIILATIVLLTGISNFHELGALSFTHNGFNLYKVKENYHGSLKNVETVADENIAITLNLTTDAINSGPYQSKIETNIRDKTKYSNGVINIELNTN